MIKVIVLFQVLILRIPFVESYKETGHNVFFKSDFSGAGIGFDAVLV